MSENQEHHLRVNEKGYYQMRITVNHDPKLVGMRKVIGLGTKDLDEAIKRRDLILRVLKMFGGLSSQTIVRCQNPRSKVQNEN